MTDGTTFEVAGSAIGGRRVVDLEVVRAATQRSEVGLGGVGVRAQRRDPDVAEGSLLRPPVLSQMCTSSSRRS
jgi:hypothetical protein